MHPTASIDRLSPARPPLEALHHEWHGPRHADRPTVVFLHDGLGAIGSWKQIAADTAARCRCNALLFDRWGYGKSPSRPSFPPKNFMHEEALALAAFLDRLRLPRVHLVGHSDGASIALIFAALYPGRALSLVSEAAHVFVEERCLQGIRALADAQAAGTLPPWLERLHGSRADGLLRAWCTAWLSDAHRRWNIEPYLAYIEAPLLVIQGHDDAFGTMAQVDSILRRTRRAEDWRLDHCDHVPHAEHPKTFLERLTAFLEREMS